MLDITFYDWQRRSGKTTTLKLNFQELKDDFSTICVFGHNQQTTAELFRYCKKYAPYKKVVHSVDELRGMKDCKILVLIDEPLLIHPEKQSTILMTLEYISKWTDITVLGWGTDDPNPFRRYVV